MSGITASQIEAYGLPRRVNNPVTGTAPQAPVTSRSASFSAYTDTSPSVALLGVLAVLVLIHFATVRGAVVD